MKVLHLEIQIPFLCVCGWVGGSTQVHMYMRVHVCGGQRLASALLLNPSLLYFSASLCLITSAEQDWQEDQRFSCLCFPGPGTTDVPLPMTFHMDPGIRTQASTHAHQSANRSHLYRHRHMLLSCIDYSGNFIDNIPKVSHLLEFLYCEPSGRKKDFTPYVRAHISVCCFCPWQMSLCALEIWPEHFKNPFKQLFKRDRILE